MAGVNRVLLIGHLGADPEVKTFEGDNTVANVNLATTEFYKDKNGNKVDVTEWHSLEFWGAQAKVAGQYLKKGSQIYVEGKIKTETWEDKDGNKKYRTKIRVSSMTMLGGPKDSANQSTPQEARTTPGSMVPRPIGQFPPDFFIPDEEQDGLPF